MSAQQSRRTSRITALALAATAVFLWNFVPLAALAHGTAPPELAFWGPFGARTVQCLRTIGQATQRCFGAVVAAERECADRQRAGDMCDQPERAARIAAATQTASDAVDNACLGGQLTELRFAGFDDAKTDVLRGCVSESEAVMSLLYPHDGSAAGMAPENAVERACIDRVAALSQKLLGATMRSKERALDRIAFRILPPSRKQALLTTAEARVSRVRQRITERLTSACRDFEATYGRSPEELVDRLSRRGDCVLNSTYFVVEVPCPTPVCGNRIKEFGEACDDGNTNDGDGCRSDCSAGA